MDVERSDNTHLISFCGKFIEPTVTDKSSVADEWVQNILVKYHGQEIIVGFDCKYTTSHPITSMNENIATLQLCVDNNCLIFQLAYLQTIPQSLKSFLTDNPNVSLFGVEIHENVSKLHRRYALNCGANSKIIDIRALVKIMFPLSCCRVKPSLKAMAYKIAGLSVRRWNKNCKVEWDSTGVLDRELVEYACVDAYACYRIAHNLLN